MSVDLVQHAEIEPGSNRSFGIVFAVFFGIIALYPVFFGAGVRLWAAGFSLAFLGAAIVYPKAMAPLNKAWFKFGILLSRFVNPIVMFLIYAIAILPAGLIVRMLGKDLLRLSFKPNDDSYWISRSPPGPDPESLNEQF